MPPNNTYIPPHNPIDNTISPPEQKPQNSHKPSSSSTGGSYGGSSSNHHNNITPPPPTHKPAYHGGSSSHITELLPPKEPENNCPGTIQYCDSTNGCLIIPIELKNRNTESCCSTANYAKLILPLKNFDEDTVKKITEAVPRDIDANDLIHNILNHLL
jgi:hypothetical protein